MYKKHSLEERLLAVKKCLEGLSPRCVGRQLGINSSYISEWLYKYQREGSKGLEKRPFGWNIPSAKVQKISHICK
jgi:transposase